VTDVGGAITNYEYSPVGGASRMTCVRRPGQSTCQITNQYAACQRQPELNMDPPNLRQMDRVTHQQTSTGETYSYVHSAAPYCPPTTDSTKTTMTASGAGTTEVATNESGAPMWVKDPLGRTTINEYPFTTYPVPPTLPFRIQLPEGQQYHIGYLRGNVSGVRAVARPGTGAADLTSSTLYEISCSNVRICNRPKSTTDSNGNRTDFTYDPTHGGLRTETGPAVNPGSGSGAGLVRPETRHHYQQRSAWISDGAGSYQASAAPIWVRTSTSTCRASAATGNESAPCAGGDEVLTTYDYGPDSGPNNLQVRGTIVSAGGESLRTCFGYDALGNKISETRPRAGLTTCP
jgi:YD repeat-containing protein